MTISAQDVLLALFNPSDTVCFRVFDDKKGGVFTGAKFEMEAGKYTAIEGTLKNHNDKNHGVFIRCLSRGFVRFFQKNFQHRNKPSFCISFMCSVPLSIV